MNDRVLTVEGKQFGRGRPSLFPAYELAAPSGAGEGIALRDLIAHVVRCEVEAFQERRERRRLLQTLTANQIEDAAALGKVTMGGREEDEGDVDPAAAVRVALQGFDDGLYFVFVDDRQYESLDEAVPLGARSALMFLRLVALAGG